MTDDSDYSLELARTRTMDDIPELPDSVAESPLFLLPREIRDRVYSFCLTVQEGSQIEWPAENTLYGLQVQLVRTCKIIHDEAAPMLYTLNTLTFHHPSDANMFVRAYSAPTLSRHISYLNLHIKAQDTRLWMPYITSRDRHRSLEADFPHLRELGIRFRSNKWQHSLTPEANLKIWSEDSRLDEIVDGIRNVYLPDGPRHRHSKHDRELDTYISNNSASLPPDNRSHNYDKERMDLDRSDSSHRQTSIPIIKVTCACRVHSSHFNALTAPPPSTLTTDGVNSNLPDLSEANNGTGVIQQTPPTVGEAPTPVREGDPFRGFTPMDLRTNPIKKLHDPDLGSANVAHTPFADKNGVLLGLEIHSLDPKKDGGVG
jgi:hypothetical protein